MGERVIMPEGVVLQEIRNFVVQIRHSTTDQIVGTGFITKKGVVTCAHVVRAAGVDPGSRDGGDLRHLLSRTRRPIEPSEKGQGCSLLSST